MVDVIKELEALRQNLLDLSLRNNLLNYRPSQKRTVSIADRTPEEIYRAFCSPGKINEVQVKNKVQKKQ